MKLKVFLSNKSKLGDEMEVVRYMLLLVDMIFDNLGTLI